MKNLLLVLPFILTTHLCLGQLSVGDAAPEITLPNTSDGLIKLSSLRGRIILVDFWASWCAPCRAANPTLLGLYKKYKAVGFEILAVSLDTKKAAWLSAIRQDKLTYMQVNDKAGWNSTVAEQYKVEEIPTSFLLDKTGKIIAINLEGDALNKQLAELLK